MMPQRKIVFSCASNLWDDIFAGDEMYWKETFKFNFFRSIKMNQVGGNRQRQENPIAGNSELEKFLAEFQQRNAFLRTKERPRRSAPTRFQNN